MKYSKVFIDAIGYELPSLTVLTSDLEEQLESVFDRLHIPMGQIEALTGIYERRWWEPGVNLADCAAKAGQKALDKCNVKPEDIGMVVYSGVYREEFEPAASTMVASKLGISEDSIIFDVSNACLGVMNAILEVANHIELGHIKAGLVISAESAREINELTIKRLLEGGSLEFFLSSIATLTGGSGAVGIIVTDGSFGEQRRKLDCAIIKSASQFNRLCRWGMEKLQNGLERMFMMTNSSAVLKNGIILALKTWQSFLKATGWTINDIKRTICHQVGMAHQNSLLKALSIPFDLDFVTYPYLGNIGPVSLPITAAIAEERGFLQNGMKTSFMGIGSGLNCMMLGVEW